MKQASLPAYRVRSLSVRNLRGFGDPGVEFVGLDADVVVITGPNGVGKTTLVDAFNVALNRQGSDGVDQRRQSQFKNGRREAGPVSVSLEPWGPARSCRETGTSVKRSWQTTNLVSARGEQDERRSLATVYYHDHIHDFPLEDIEDWLRPRSRIQLRLDSCIERAVEQLMVLRSTFEASPPKDPKATRRRLDRAWARFAAIVNLGRKTPLVQETRTKAPKRWVQELCRGAADALLEVDPEASKIEPTTVVSAVGVWRRVIDIKRRAQLDTLVAGDRRAVTQVAPSAKRFLSGLPADVVLGGDFRDIQLGRPILRLKAAEQTGRQSLEKEAAKLEHRSGGLRRLLDSIQKGAPLRKFLSQAEVIAGAEPETLSECADRILSAIPEDFDSLGYTRLQNLSNMDDLRSFVRFSGVLAEMKSSLDSVSRRAAEERASLEVQLVATRRSLDQIDAWDALDLETRNTLMSVLSSAPNKLDANEALRLLESSQRPGSQRTADSASEAEGERSGSEEAAVADRDLRALLSEFESVTADEEANERAMEASGHLSAARELLDAYLATLSRVRAASKEATEIDQKVVTALTEVAKDVLQSFLVSTNGLLHSPRFECLPMSRGSEARGLRLVFGSDKSDRLEIRQLSTGQRAYAILLQMLLINLAFRGQLEVETDDPGRRLPLRTLIFDDFVASLDLSQLPGVAALLRAFAYNTNEDLRRQIILTSHHEGLTNRLIDLLSPPPGCKACLVDLRGWESSRPEPVHGIPIHAGGADQEISSGMHLPASIRDNVRSVLEMSFG